MTAQERLYLDLVDSDLRVCLPVALLELVVLSPTVLADDDLGSLNLAKHGSNHLRLGHDGSTDLRATFAITHKQHAIELYGLSFRRKLLVFHVQDLPFFDTILMIPVTDNRVHALLLPQLARSSVTVVSRGVFRRGSRISLERHSLLLPLYQAERTCGLPVALSHSRKLQHSLTIAGKEVKRAIAPDGGWRDACTWANH